MANLPLREGARHEILLQLRFDVFAALVRALAVDSILAGTAAEEGSGQAVPAERGEDPAEPEHEAPSRRSDTGEEVLVHSVDEEDAVDIVDVAGGEDAAVDPADTSGDEDPGSLLTGLGECFGKGICGHSGREGGGRVVGPGEAGAVPVAVAGDGAVLVGVVDPVVEGIFEGFFAGFDEDGGGGGGVAHAGDVDLVFVVVDEIAVSWRGKGGVAGAEDEGAGEEEDDDDVDDHDN